MKKVLTVLMLLSLMLVAMMVSVSATEPDETTAPCNHNWVKVPEECTAPTCEDDGEDVYKCSRCDDIKTEDVDSLGHDYVKVNEESSEPTCEDDGKLTEECSVCHDKKVTRLDALGHVCVETRTEPTCQEEGSILLECERCDYEETTVLAKKDHDFSVYVGTSATCTTAGEATYKCSMCNETEKRAAAATGHDYKASGGPTCTTSGKYTYTCKNCSDTYQGETVGKLDHDLPKDLDDWEILDDGGCEEDTRARAKCARCNKYVTDTFDAPGHDYDLTKKYITREPTKALTGSYIVYCKNCGETKSYSITKGTTALSSYYVPNVVPSEEPGRVEEGTVIYFTCDFDDVKIYYSTNGNDPAKTSSGRKTYDEDDGIEIDDDTVTIKIYAKYDGDNGVKDSAVSTYVYTSGECDHDYGDQRYITKLPTKSAVGYYITYCEDCGESKRGTISKGEDDLDDYKVPLLVPSKKAGNVTEGTVIYFECPYADVKIYYSTNGNDPAETSSGRKTYDEDEGIKINDDTTIKIYAKYDGDDDFDIEDSDTQTFKYVVKECDHDYGSDRYVTKLPTSSSTGSYVVYCEDCGEAKKGTIPKGEDDLDDYLLPPLEASKESGKVTEGTVIYFTSDIDDVIIYYALDGRSPTSSSYRKVYDEDDGIEITEDTTIKIYSKYDDDDFDIEDSEIQTFNYTVEECDHDYGSDRYVTKLPTSSAAGSYVVYCEDCGEAKKGTISKGTTDLDDYSLPRLEPSKKEGEVSVGTKIYFTSDITDVIIYYALDGRSPTSTSYRQVYDKNKGIEITKDTTIKIYSVYDDDNFDIEDSEVQTFKYTVGECDHDYGDKFITRVPTSTTAGAYITYCEDCNQSKTGTINKGEDDLDDYKLHALTASHQTGTIPYGTVVKFTAKMTSGVKIYYTTDGKSPVTSTTRQVYNANTGITITSLTAIKVYCTYTANTSYGIEDSDIQTFTYNVSNTAPVYLKPEASKGGYMKLGADKKFRPDDKATRYEVMEAMDGLFATSKPASTTVYKDVDAAHKTIVAKFIGAGLLNGYDDGTFRGTASIKRSELCKVLALALDLDLTVKAGTKQFPDVPTTHWAHRYISALTAAGYLAGDTDGNFRPEDNITRAELCTVLNRVAKISTGSGVTFADMKNTHWAYGYVCAAIDKK